MKRKSWGWSSYQKNVGNKKWFGKMKSKKYIHQYVLKTFQTMTMCVEMRMLLSLFLVSWWREFTAPPAWYRYFPTGKEIRMNKYFLAIQKKKDETKRGHLLFDDCQHGKKKHTWPCCTNKFYLSFCSLLSLFTQKQAKLLRIKLKRTSNIKQLKKQK